MIEHIQVEGFGKVRISRRTGMRTIRIGVTQNGEVRLSLPARVSLEKGILFLREKKAWIQKNTPSEGDYLDDGARIGKAHTLRITPTGSSKVRTTITQNAIFVHIPDQMSAENVQLKLSVAAKKALKIEAESLLPQQLRKYAQDYEYVIKSIEVKPLRSRWGSCSNHNDIVLNTYLMQLPWALIDYVLLHELTHTKHHNHSSAFWDSLGQVLPDYKKRRKALKKYPTAVFDARESEKYMS